MFNLLNVDYLRVNKMVREFTKATGLRGETQFVCIYRSANFKNERQVFKVSVGDRLFALKVDRVGAKTQRLTSEFAVLQDLHLHFAGHDKQTIPEPIYLSTSGEFFVVDFIDHHTATDAIKGTTNARSAGQAYRRAGAWLHALHCYKPLTTKKIYPDWMFNSMDRSIDIGPHAPAEKYQRFIDIFHRDVDEIRERRDACAFCHGDFHAENLILGEGVNYGFDFTETTEKLAIYDIVDFLKVDIFRADVDADVDRSGVARQAKDMFFKLYRHPVDRALLDVCLRGRLLIDWVFITSERHTKSEFQRNKYERLERRLDLAFGQG